MVLSFPRYTLGSLLHVLQVFPQMFSSFEGFIETPLLIIEKEMAIHSSILAWKIPWIEEPGTVHEVAGVRHDLERKQTLRIEP